MSTSATNCSDRIRLAAESAGFRQADLCRLLPASPGYVSNVWHGRRGTEPLARHVERLALIRRAIRALDAGRPGDARELLARAQLAHP